MNYKIINLFFVILIFVFFSVIFKAESYPETNLINYEHNYHNVENLLNGQSQFYKVRDMYHNEEEKNHILNQKLLECRKIFAQISDGFQKYYLQAQVVFLQGEIARSSRNKEKASKYYQECISLINEAIKINPNDSDLYRLLADTYMRLLINQGDPSSVRIYATRAYYFLGQSINLDNKNYPTYNSMAAYLIYSPETPEKSLDNAIEYLHSALKSKDRFDNYFSYCYLSIAYAQKKENERADYFLKEALKIYPHSLWIKKIYNNIKTGKYKNYKKSPDSLIIYSGERD